MGTVGVGLLCWVVAAIAIRLLFPSEVARRLTGEEPEYDEIEIRGLPEPDCPDDHTTQPLRLDDPMDDD